MLSLCQTRVLKRLLSQTCVGIILRSPPISCRQGRYTRETDCGLDSRTSIMYCCEHKTRANTLVRESRHQFSVELVPKFNILTKYCRISSPMSVLSGKALIPGLLPSERELKAVWSNSASQRPGPVPCTYPGSWSGGFPGYRC